MATANIKEVAQHAGVSVGTVSNVLNRPWLVAQATRQRVQSAIRELGFVRNEAARHLRAGRSRTVGLVVLDVANPFFTDVTRGAETVGDAHEIMVVLCNSAEDPVRERRHLDQLEQQRVLGVLITPVESDSSRLEELVARGTPVVLVDRIATGPLCSVSVDDLRGGRLAGEHLAGQGHRLAAFVGGPFSIAQVTDRHAGFTASGIDVVTISTHSLSVAEGRRAGALIAELERDTRPTAVFCANDLLALGFMQEMTRRGIKVPGEMAIVGYDDIDFAGAATVPLTSVRQPRELLGRTALELLLEEVDQPSQHKHRQVTFQPELVIRESSELHL